jgi:hypothetical protein
MNRSRGSEVLGQAERAQDHRDHPSVDAVPQARDSDEQTPPRPAGPTVPDGGTAETFINGAGI